MFGCCPRNYQVNSRSNSQWGPRQMNGWERTSNTLSFERDQFILRLPSVYTDNTSYNENISKAVALLKHPPWFFLLVYCRVTFSTNRHSFCGTIAWKFSVCAIYSKLHLISNNDKFTEISSNSSRFLAQFVNNGGSSTYLFTC